MTSLMTTMNVNGQASWQTKDGSSTSLCLKSLSLRSLRLAKRNLPFQFQTNDSILVSIPLYRPPSPTLLALPSVFQGILDQLNATLGTSYTLDIPTLSSVLEIVIENSYDFGTAYGLLRQIQFNNCGIIQYELMRLEKETRSFDGTCWWIT